MIMSLWNYQKSQNNASQERDAVLQLILVVFYYILSSHVIDPHRYFVEHPKVQFFTVALTMLNVITITEFSKALVEILSMICLVFHYQTAMNLYFNCQVLKIVANYKKSFRKLSSRFSNDDKTDPISALISELNEMSSATNNTFLLNKGEILHLALQS
jgi:hypothetical protein